MTSFLAKTAHDMKILTKTLQNQIIIESFAKNRMSKALFVKTKIADGRTDRHLKVMVSSRFTAVQRSNPP